jgi:hypothetical protein
MDTRAVIIGIILLSIGLFLIIVNFFIIGFIVWAMIFGLIFLIYGFFAKNPPEKRF